MLVEIPVSVGELVDKVTILNIKLKHSSGDANNNIKLELDLLNKKLKSITIPQEYYEMLEHINQRLWEMEDAIRQKESSREFDNDFILYARMIYMYNDSRASVKRKINELTGSEVVEEKIFS